MFNIILGLIALVASAVFLRRKLLRDANNLAQKTEGIFSELLPLLSDVNSQPGEAAGSWTVIGKHTDHVFQFRSIIDTLATRKLPSLWLQVTLPKPQSFDFTLDIMRRPNGPTTFSNFDFLPYSLQRHPAFPEDAVVKSNSSDVPPRLIEILASQSSVFGIPKMKELLLSPKGLRIVVQISEGDRLRHGVFRQADFGDTKISPDLAIQVMTALLTLDADLGKYATNG